MGDTWKSLGQATAWNKCFVMKEHFGISGCGMLGSSVCPQPQRDQEDPGSPGRHSQTHSCLMSVSLKGEAVILLDFICALPQDTGKSRLQELLYGVPDGLPWAASPVLFPALGQYSCSLSPPICLGDLGQARPEGQFHVHTAP